MKRSALAVMALLAGCTVGPDYRQPQVAVPAAYSEPRKPGETDVALSAWWQAFHDPQLTRLIDRALARNLDVELATARIREARALERVAGASALPSVAGEASAARQRISEHAIPLPPGASSSDGGAGFALPGTEFSTFRIGFDAGWEIDLFGRTRRGIEAAGARTGAAIWNSRDIQGSVAAEVASSYLRLRTLQARTATAAAELAQQERLVRLMAARTHGGMATGEDLARQRSERAATAASIPALQARTKLEIHALGVLVGATPDALSADLSQPAARPLPPQIPPGLPSTLLRRRPDIRAAERELAAATADVGVAVAELYPSFSLTAAPALVSTALGTLLEWGSRGFSTAAAVDWPLFDGGRRRANVEVRNARQEQALIAYRRTILAALHDVENALGGIDGARQQLARLEESIAEARRAESLAETRYRGGLVTLSDVLEAQAHRLVLETQMIDTQGALAQDTIALAKALGGGWAENGL